MYTFLIAIIDCFSSFSSCFDCTNNPKSKIHRSDIKVYSVMKQNPRAKTKKHNNQKYHIHVRT